MAYPKFTPVQMVDAIHQNKGMVTKVAEQLRCEPNTVRNYVARHPSVAQALREERERMTDIAELALFDAIRDGEAWAVCFYLKTQGKARGYIERHEVTGADGDPLRIQLSWDDGSEHTITESIMDYPAPAASRPALRAAESGAL